MQAEVESVIRVEKVMPDGTKKPFYVVHFRIDDLMYDKLEIPAEEFSTEKVKKLIQERAATLKGILTMSIEV